MAVARQPNTACCTEASPKAHFMSCSAYRFIDFPCTLHRRTHAHYAQQCRGQYLARTPTKTQETILVGALVGGSEKSTAFCTILHCVLLELTHSSILICGFLTVVEDLVLLRQHCCARGADCTILLRLSLQSGHRSSASRLTNVWPRTNLP